MNFNLRNTIILILFFGIITYLLIAIGIHTKFFPFNNILNSSLNKKISTTNSYTGKTFFIEKFDKETKKDFDNFWKNLNAQGEINYENKLNIYWANRVKNGGLILLFRHAERQKWHEAVTGFDAYELYNKLDAREFSWFQATCLTEKGIETAKMIKLTFEHGNIPIQKVFSSPSCRARETSIYGFGRIDEIHNALLHYTAFNPLDHDQLGRDLKKTVLNFPLEKDKNLILSAHNSVVSYPNFIDQFNIEEGLDETGFYVIEKKDNRLIVRHKFFKSKTFNTLMYRWKYESKVCPEPKNPKNNCYSM